MAELGAIFKEACTSDPMTIQAQIEGVECWVHLQVQTCISRDVFEEISPEMEIWSRVWHVQGRVRNHQVLTQFPNRVSSMDE